MTGKERKMGNQFVSNYVKEDPIQFNQPSLLKNKLSGLQHYLPACAPGCKSPVDFENQIN